MRRRFQLGYSSLVLGLLLFCFAILRHFREIALLFRLLYRGSAQPSLCVLRVLLGASSARLSSIFSPYTIRVIRLILFLYAPKRRAMPLMIAERPPLSILALSKDIVTLFRFFSPALKIPGEHVFRHRNSEIAFIFLSFDEYHQHNGPVFHRGERLKPSMRFLLGAKLSGSCLPRQRQTGDLQGLCRPPRFPLPSCMPSLSPSSELTDQSHFDEVPPAPLIRASRHDPESAPLSASGVPPLATADVASANCRGVAKTNPCPIDA